MGNEAELVTTFLDKGILRIGIQRPDKLNALTLAMYDSMTVALESAEQDQQVRVILIHGAENCFTSGQIQTSFC